MITAHLPSGYLLYRTTRSRSRLVLAACLIGATFPDFDLIWFFFIDDRAVHHHRYWVHAPGFWLLCLALAAPFLWRMRSEYRRTGLAFFAGWLLHLCLDTIVGSIMWLWPVSDRFYQLTTVQATHSHYILSFMAHWSFMFEIAIWLIAGALLWLRRAR